MNTETIPHSTTVPAAVSKAAWWTGTVLSAIPSLMLLSGSVFAAARSKMVIDGFTHLGYLPSHALVIAGLELLCAVLYIIPKTSILGAILMTAYMGGATASHVRIQEAPTGALIMGILVWAGLYLREQRIRDVIPFKTS